MRAGVFLISETELEIMAAILRLKSGNGRDIMRASGQNLRGKSVYTYLRRLEQKGLLTSVTTKGNTSYGRQQQKVYKPVKEAERVFKAWVELKDSLAILRKAVQVTQ
ncbi:MAG TPA: BlaI/MecI/CopY family transcriptional regulator [Patescibacteria group bacterium]|nr:BlaI/MecI/CopY family transcriptional regulator [Patescibacteria group bacterium]